MIAPYVELKARSAFSFGDGAVSPEVLAERAAAIGYEALALVDTADVGGIVRFALSAGKHGLRPIVGAELRVDGYPLALIVRNERGYRNLAHLITRSRRENERGSPGLVAADLADRGEGLHLLTGRPTGGLATLLRRSGPEAARERLARWREIFGDRLAVEVQRHHVSGSEESLARSMIELAGRAGVPWVVTNEPRYVNAAGRWVHDLQTALRVGL